MKRLYVGMDLGASVCATAVKSAGGNVLGKTEFETSGQNLIRFLKGLEGEIHVMFEEGEMAGWAYRLLSPYAKEVIVCDPKRNAWIARSSVKNDSVDALKLAELLRLGSYAKVYHSDHENMEAFKKTVQLDQEMSWKVVALKNQIKAQFRREGVFLRGQSVYGARGKEKALQEVRNKVVKQLIIQNYSLLEKVKESQEKARSFFLSLCRRFSIIKLFDKVPGMGPILAGRFVAYIQTPHRFSSKRQIWRYSRLGVAERRSDGKPLARKRLDRSGNGTLKDVSRKAFNAAMRKKSSNLFQRTRMRSLEETGDAVHARLSTQRKILATLWAMWRDGTEYNDGIDGYRA
jgi:transposase